MRTYSRLQAPTPGCRHLLQLSDLPTTTVVLAYTSHISHRPTATIWLWKDARSSIAACGPPLTYALKTVEPVDGRSTTKVEKPWMYTSTTAPPLVDLMFVMKSRERNQEMLEQVCSYFKGCHLFPLSNFYCFSSSPQPEFPLNNPKRSNHQIQHNNQSCGID